MGANRHLRKGDSCTAPLQEENQGGKANQLKQTLTKFLKRKSIFSAFTSFSLSNKLLAPSRPCNKALILWFDPKSFPSNMWRTCRNSDLPAIQAGKKKRKGVEVPGGNQRNHHNPNPGTETNLLTTTATPSPTSAPAQPHWSLQHIKNQAPAHPAEEKMQQAQEVLDPMFSPLRNGSKVHKGLVSK